jgi:hypothetical protein
MGKSASAPPTPDYVGAAKQQGKDNLIAARESNVMSNPNMITPFGNQTVTYSSPTFNQAGFDEATANYNAGGNVDRNRFMRQGDPEGDRVTGASYFDQAGYDAEIAKRGAAPTRESYMTGGGQPTVTQTLSPQAQQTLDSQMRVQTALANLGETGIANARETLSRPFVPTSTEIQRSFGDPNSFNAQSNIDTSGIAAMPINAGTNAQKLIMERLNPTIEAGDTSFKQALANQGLAPGTAAYDAAYRNRSNQINDLYNQAALQGINLDLTANQQGFNQAQARAGLYNQAMSQNFGQQQGAAQFANTAQQQQLAQDMALRSQPINEVIGLMGGSQIQLPQFQGYQGAQVAPAPTFAGTQAQGQADMQRYGIQQAGNNAMTQGLFSALGSAAMLAPKFSDRRLKSNIVQVGTHPLGIGIYEYDIFGNRERGVMADEVAKVMPEAIVPHESGYMMVNYGKL